MSIDVSNVLAGGQVLTQSPDSLLGKGIQDYIQDALEHASIYGERMPIFSPCHSLLSTITDNVQKIELTDREKKINGGLNQNFDTIFYNTVDLSQHTHHRNPALGGMLKSSGGVDMASYSFKESISAENLQGTPAEARKYEVLLRGNPNANVAGYFKALHARGLQVFTVEQLINLLNSLTSEPFSAEFKANGLDVYQVNSNEKIFSKFNFAGKFGGGAGSNGNDMIIYGDGSDEFAIPAGTFNQLPREKVEALFQRLDPVLGAKSRREIYLFCPMTIAKSIMNERRVEMNYNGSGLRQEEFLKILANGNSIVGQGTMQVDPHFNYASMNQDQLTYVVIPDWIWSTVFGSAATKSIKDGTTDVYTLFALTHNSIDYRSSELLMQQYVPAATVDAVPYGVEDMLVFKQKYTSVISDPYGLVAVEVAAGNLKLKTSIPNMNFKYKIA